MPRRARIRMAGVPVHIIQRGNNRSACFSTDSDFIFYLKTLSNLLPECQCELHTYVLMTNHVHLLLTPLETNSASLLMKHLGQRYVQYFNRTYDRTGTLWEGRFRSCIAQDDLYVLNCYRYIELNPVRANMVKHPLLYPWSGYGVNAYGHQSGFITPHRQYMNLGISPAERIQKYRHLLNQVLDENIVKAIRQATNSNHVLGNTTFASEVEATLKCRVTPGRPGRPKKKTDN